MRTLVLFRSLPALFSLTLFLSAGLLFLVEPMIAKMILPLLGGTPAVWNTCMMFFQAILLAGYGYAHISASKTSLNRQIIIHLVLFIAACLVLPIAVSRQWAPSSEGSPIGYILLLLLLSVGLPFFVLSATSLLLQKWFADTGHPSAKDPYFLYSASNLGSMLALIAYPALIEPHLRLAEQSRFWSVGYVLLLIFTAFCAGFARKYRSTCLPEDAEKTEACVRDDLPLTFWDRGRWILLAFVPSSLMLGVTTFLSTDVAAIPLFWVIPLALYLLSFIIVFARVPAMVHRVMVLLLPVSMTALIFVTFSDIGIPQWVVFIFHLVNFFIYCMVCHGGIAGSRPATEHLTEFYFWISFGGVLGGIFNALIAPVAFTIVLEYPLALVLGAMLVPVRNRLRLPNLKNWKNSLLYLGVLLALSYLTYWSTTKWPIENIKLETVAGLLHMELNTLHRIITFGLLALLCNGLVVLRKPALFGIGIAAVLMTIVLTKDISSEIVHRERNFFGVLAVMRESDSGFMTLYHGTTIHGRQWLDPYRQRDPLSYYHRKGPVGEVFSEFSGERRKARIAVTGLGAGTMAAYGEKGQEIDFYEINPAVKKIATNPVYFTYEYDSPAIVKIILGDARLTMEKAPPHHYGIIILDAFSSDAIPVHLITQEAIKLYFSKLNQDGVLLFHISNRYVDLAPVLARLADDGGFVSAIRSDDDAIGEEKFRSTYVLVARKEEDFGGLAGTNLWEKIELRKNVKVWTDDFSNILSVFEW